MFPPSAGGVFILRLRGINIGLGVGHRAVVRAWLSICHSMIQSMISVLSRGEELACVREEV